jgi:hypothetical protein
MRVEHNDSLLWLLSLLFVPFFPAAQRKLWRFFGGPFGLSCINGEATTMRSKFLTRHLAFSFFSNFFFTTNNSTFSGDDTPQQQQQQQQQRHKDPGRSFLHSLSQTKPTPPGVSSIFFSSKNLLLLLLLLNITFSLVDPKE